jgi:hypothetical protein
MTRLEEWSMAKDAALGGRGDWLPPGGIALQ